MQPDFNSRNLSIPRGLLPASILTAALMLCGLTTEVRADTVVKGFDNVSAPGPFAFIFPGLANGPQLNYPEVFVDGGVILTDDLFNNTATSGNNIYASCDTCLLGDNPPSGLPGFVRGFFTNTVDSVDLDVINGSTSSGGTYTLTVRNSGGSVIASDAVFLSTMGGPSPVGHLSVSVPGIASFRVDSSLTFYTFAIDTLTFHEQEGTWTNLGLGLAGTHGTPSLVGAGSLIADEPMSLDLSGALENATTYLVVSPLALNFFPFYGGTLVPDPSPPGTFFVLGTDAGGNLDIAANWLPGVPPGLELYFQHWVLDGGGPFGFAASNAVKAVTP
jgi:hypothetical protein